MYGKFVGLDIGSESIKIALVKRGIRRVELVKTLYFNFSDPSGISGILEKIFRENNLPPSDVATSVRKAPVSIRILSFPFSDPKKIDQVYEFELESVSTFDPRDKVHAYHLIKGQKESEAITCMFNKEDVKEVIDICEAGGVDPKVITLSAVAFVSLNEFLSGQRPVLLVNIGASKTSFSLFDELGLKRIRSSTKAGDYVARIISNGFNVPKEEVERIKKQGFYDDGRSDILREGVRPVVDDIRKTIQFFELDLRDEIKTVLVSGGFSLIPGFIDYLRKELKRDVRMLFIPDLGEKNSAVFAESFALALYGSGFRRGCLNLRKGEFRYTGKTEGLERTFMVPSVLFSLLLVLLLYRSGARYFELKDEIRELETRIERSVKDVFPNMGTVPKPVAFMETEVGKLKQKLQILEEIKGGATPLDVLRDISISIPGNVNLRVDEITFIDGSVVRIRGQCSSSEEVLRIERALSNSGFFKRVTRDSTETSPNKSIRFQISLVVNNG